MLAGVVLAGVVLAVVVGGLVDDVVVDDVVLVVLVVVDVVDDEGDTVDAIEVVGGVTAGAFSVEGAVVMTGSSAGATLAMLVAHPVIQRETSAASTVDAPFDLEGRDAASAAEVTTRRLRSRTWAVDAPDGSWITTTQCSDDQSSC